MRASCWPSCGETTDGSCARGAPYLAYAEDYAALLEALCTLAELDDVAWLDEARTVAGELIRLFHDADGGGFFTTGVDAEQLVVRLKDVFDDATPSANSLAANGLLRLAALTGETEFEEYAVEVLRMLAHAGASHPNGFAHLLGAIERYVTSPAEIAIIGDPNDEQTRALRREVATRLLPASVTLTGSPNDPSPLLAGREMRGGVPTAYVCEHYTCKQPVTDARNLASSSTRCSPAGSAGGEVGTGGELLGDGPAEGDHRLTSGRVERADERCDLRTARGLHRARVEDREARRLAALDRDLELAVVEMPVVAVALRQTSAPGAVLAVRRVARARHDVGIALQQDVAAGLGETRRDEHVLVGERDRGAAGELARHRP